MREERRRANRTRGAAGSHGSGHGALEGFAQDWGQDLRRNTNGVQIVQLTQVPQWLSRRELPGDGSVWALGSVGIGYY